MLVIEYLQTLSQQSLCSHPDRRATREQSKVENLMNTVSSVDAFGNADGISHG